MGMAAVEMKKAGRQEGGGWLGFGMAVWIRHAGALCAWRVGLKAGRPPS